jgi:hypothetical protein
MNLKKPAPQTYFRAPSPTPSEGQTSLTNLVDSVLVPPGVDRFAHQQEACEWRQYNPVTNVDNSPPGSSIGSVGDTFFAEAGQEMDTSAVYYHGDIEDSISRNIASNRPAAMTAAAAAAASPAEAPPLYLESVAVKRVKGYFPKSGGNETTIVRYERGDDVSRWQWQPLPTRLSISSWLDDEQEGN